VPTVILSSWKGKLASQNPPGEEFLAHVRAQEASTIVAHCYEGEAKLAYGRSSKDCVPKSLWQMRLSLEQVPVHWLSEAAAAAGTGEPASCRNSAPVPRSIAGRPKRFFEGINQVLLAVCDSAPPAFSS